MAVEMSVADIAIFVTLFSSLNAGGGGGGGIIGGGGRGNVILFDQTKDPLYKLNEGFRYENLNYFRFNMPLLNYLVWPFHNH
jgi:hypothetical protein